MKKIFSFFAALMAVIAVNAKVVTFDFTNPTALGITPSATASKGVELPAEGLTVDGVLMTSEKVQKNPNVLFTKSDGVSYELRTYNTNKITFNAGEENITSVEFVGSDVKFAEVTGKSWTGEAVEVTFTGTATSKITSITLTIGEAAQVWTPDTISVSQARALIDAKDAHDHFVIGVVAGQPFATGSTFSGKICFWLTDTKNPTDSLEAYQVLAQDNAKWASIEAAKEELQNGDTVLVYASALELYAAKNYYEINGGNYVEKLGATTPVAVEDITIAQAIEIASALEAGKTSVEKYAIEGFAVNVAAYSAQYHNQDFFLVEDAAQPDSILKVFRAAPKKEGKEYPVLAGDKLRVLGYLQNYVKDEKSQLEIVNPTIEFLEEVEGDRTIDGDQPQEEADTITVAQALEIGQKLQVSNKDNKYPSEKSYVIKGYSCGIITPFDAQYKNETFWIADEKGTRTSDKTKAFEIYRGKPNTEKEIGLDALVQFKCKILNFGGTIENFESNMVVEVLEDGVIEKVDTITVAQALEIGNALATGGVSDKEYAVKGYVSDIQDYFSEQYKNETFWITDTKGARTKDKTQAFEVYRGKPNTGKEIGLDALIIITCKIKNYNGTIENDGVNLPFEVLEQGGEVKVDTVTVAQALEIGNALEDNAYTDNPYVVIGYVVKAYDPDEGKTQQNFYMADELNVRGDFYAYKASPDSKVVAGDYVELFGKIQKYVGSKGTTIELSYGTAKHLEAPKIDTINVAQALEIGAALENGGQTEKNYFVVGYVAEITEEYDGEELESFTLSDDETEVEAEFEARDARVGETAAAVHDKVLLFGKILKDEDGKIHMNMAAARVNPGQGIMNIVVTEKARKIVVDGVIYIVRDNKIFTLQGTQVR